MEQQQFRVKLSVGTKLLLGGVLLLTVVISFLNISTIFLLKEDKKAYIYQSQGTQAILAGREVVAMGRRAIDTLRLSLGSIQPGKAPTYAENQVFQSVVKNQSELILVSYLLVDLKHEKLTVMTRGVREKELKDLQMIPEEFDLPIEQFKEIWPELTKAGYAFLNLSRVGGSPALGVLVADTQFKDAAGIGVPVGLGVISLKDYSTQLSGMALTIATRGGRVIFDSDPTVFYAKRNISSDPLFQTASGSQLSSGAKEYEAQGIQYLGSYVNSGLDLVVVSKTEWRKAMKATYALTEKFILLGLMAIAIATVFTIFFSKTLTAPINELYEATRVVARGNFDVVVDTKSKDEIGALTHSFNLMSRQINELIVEKMQKVHLENELAIASTVQQTLIPPAVFANEDIYIHSHYQPAETCGGDWWGFFGVGRKIAVMIADATGHGLPSALITASARSCVSVLHKLAKETPDFSYSPSAMLSYANRVVFDASLGKIMMTFFIGVIDFDTMTLTYASAGHNPPWLFRRENDRFTLKSLTAVGLRLGETRDSEAFEEKVVDIQPNDLLFLYTDGLLEGKNLDGSMYGKKRARQMVESSLEGGPEKIISSVIADFLEFNTGKVLDDDVTLATALIMPAPAPGPENAQV